MQTVQVAKQMGHMELLGKSETRWKGMGSTTLQSGEKVYIADYQVQQAVVIILSARAKGALMEWMPISRRVINFCSGNGLVITRNNIPTSIRIHTVNYKLKK